MRFWSLLGLVWVRTEPTRIDAYRAFVGATK